MFIIEMISYYIIYLVFTENNIKLFTKKVFDINLWCLICKRDFKVKFFNLFCLFEV